MWHYMTHALSLDYLITLRKVLNKCTLSEYSGTFYETSYRPNWHSHDYYYGIKK